jgi:alpha-tubulin suppressor-like RCC1 family protein
MKISCSIGLVGTTILSLCFSSCITNAADTNIIGWRWLWSTHETNSPVMGTNVIALAGSDYHTVALLADRSVRVWGDNTYGQTNVPAGAINTVGIAAGNYNSLALTGNGDVLMWGRMAQPPIPVYVPPEVTNVVAVGVGRGALHSVALRADGTVVDWGWSATNVPAEAINIVSVAAGSYHSLALRSDGRVVSWGIHANPVPASATNIVAIAAGDDTSVAVRANGSLLTWGSISSPPTSISNVVEVGCFQSGGGIALNGRGVATGWGAPIPIQATNIMTIGATSWGALAVKAAGSPIFPLPPVRRTVAFGQTAYFRQRVVGALPMSYQWTFYGTNLPNATNHVLVVTNVDLAKVGPYALTASNSLGTASSEEMTLDFKPLEVTVQPAMQTIRGGSNATFTAAVVGQGPFSYQWKKYGTNVDGAIQSTLSLTNVSVGDAGTYSVEASNHLGVVESVGAQLVVVPLFVLVQPQSQTVRRWAATTLNVSAGGLPPLRYQWKLNGVNIPEATNSSFAIPSMQAANAGNYVVAITNDYSGLISSTSIVRMTSLAVWGVNDCGQLNVPASATNVIGIAAGSSDGMALRIDGTVVVWGCNDVSQTNVPPGATNVVSILGGSRRSSALKADGTTIGWGLNSSGENNIPASFTNGVQIAGVVDHLLGLRADGTAVGWGYNPSGLADVPAGLSNLVGVAAGGNHSAVLRVDGTVFAWGIVNPANTNVPPDLTNVVAIAAGIDHMLALRADSTVTAWGSNSHGQTNVPSGLTNVVAISGGYHHSLALRADGTVVVWGDNSLGQTNLPPGLTNVVGIAAGWDFNIALIGDGPPQPSGLPVNPSWSGNAFTLSIDSENNRVYRLEYKNSLLDSDWIGLSLVAGTGGSLALTDTTATSSQRFYRVRRW